jgi:hypothetical protein
VSELIAVHAVLGLEMADRRLDDGTSSELASLIIRKTGRYNF